MSRYIRIPPWLNRHLMTELQCRKQYGTQEYRNIAQTLSDSINKIKAHLEFKLARVIKKSFSSTLPIKEKGKYDGLVTD